MALYWGIVRSMGKRAIVWCLTYWVISVPPIYDQSCLFTWLFWADTLDPLMYWVHVPLIRQEPYCEGRSRGRVGQETLLEKIKRKKWLFCFILLLCNRFSPMKKNHVTYFFPLSLCACFSSSQSHLWLSAGVAVKLLIPCNYKCKCLKLQLKPFL